MNTNSKLVIFLILGLIIVSSFHFVLANGTPFLKLLGSWVNPDTFAITIFGDNSLGEDIFNQVVQKIENEVKILTEVCQKPSFKLAVQVKDLTPSAAGHIYGKIKKTGGTSFKILINARTSPEELSQTISHELSHLFGDLLGVKIKPASPICEVIPTGYPAANEVKDCVVAMQTFGEFIELLPTETVLLDYFVTHLAGIAPVDSRYRYTISNVIGRYL